MNSFLKDQKGNMSLLLAVTCGVVITGVGAAVDLHGVHKAEAALQNQMDTGILAAAVAKQRYDALNVNEISNDGNDESGFDFEGEMHSIMVRNGYSSDAPKPDIQNNGRVYSADLTIPYKTIFGSFVGKSSVDISADTGVTMGSMERMEIALVLDNTASMGLDGKFGALRTGAYRLIDAIETSGSGTKVALVPFAKYVRLDPTDYATAPWLSVPAPYDTDRNWMQATHTGGICNMVPTTIMKDGFPYTYDAEVCTGQTTTYVEMNKTVESRWEGCVGTRDEPDNAEDGNYTNKIPGLLNTSPREETGLSGDVEAWCPYPITPLTNNYADLRQDIQEHYATDTTYIPSGLIWGRRILSSQVPFDQADTTVRTKQAIVLMTDGKNSAQIDNSPIAQADMRNPPYLSDVGETDSAPKADALMTQMCDDIKSDGIEIFTIAFRVGHTPTETLLANCATDVRHAFIADDNAGLIQVFETIPTFFEGDIRLTR